MSAGLALPVAARRPSIRAQPSPQRKARYLSEIAACNTRQAWPAAGDRRHGVEFQVFINRDIIGKIIRQREIRPDLSRTLIDRDRANLAAFARLDIGVNAMGVRIILKLRLPRLRRVLVTRREQRQPQGGSQYSSERHVFRPLSRIIAKTT